MPLDIRQYQRPPHCFSTLEDAEIQRQLLQAVGVRLNTSTINLSSTSKRSAQSKAEVDSEEVSKLLPNMGLIPSKTQPYPQIGADMILSRVAAHEAESIDGSLASAITAATPGAPIIDRYTVEESRETESVDGSSTITEATPRAPIVDSYTRTVEESCDVIEDVAIPQDASQSPLGIEGGPNNDQNVLLETGQIPIERYQNGMPDPSQQFRMRDVFN